MWLSYSLSHAVKIKQNLKFPCISRINGKDIKLIKIFTTLDVFDSILHEDILKIFPQRLIQNNNICLTYLNTETARIIPILDILGLPNKNHKIQSIFASSS